MGLKKKISTPTTSAMKKLRRKSPHPTISRRLNKPERGGATRHNHNGGGASTVSDKLEALKNLIPSENSEIKADQLFQETADYIVLLKTQVFVLQKLIDFYGSQQPQDNQISV